MLKQPWLFSKFSLGNEYGFWETICFSCHKDLQCWRLTKRNVDFVKSYGFLTLNTDEQKREILLGNYFVEYLIPAGWEESKCYVLQQLPIAA